eukprot:1859614-Rhodomonas_salina.3
MHVNMPTSTPSVSLQVAADICKRERRCRMLIVLSMTLPGGSAKGDAPCDPFCDVCSLRQSKVLALRCLVLKWRLIPPGAATNAAMVDFHV